MPIYEYQCADCSHAFETMQKFSDEPVKCARNVQARKYQAHLSVILCAQGNGWFKSAGASCEKRKRYRQRPPRPALSLAPAVRPVKPLSPMDIKNTALHAAKTAGLLLREKLGAKQRIEYKGAIDLVTEMDKRSEAVIIKEIKKKFPDHGIMAEESAEFPARYGCRWIIDPLDGTTNYAHGLPVFCVSIGFEKAGKIILGVVYNPMLDEMFVAEKGCGARLNGKRIRVSGTGSLDASLLATGFPYDIRTTQKNNLDHFSAFAVRAQAIRRAGAAALDLCYVACSRFDGFWELKLKPWDTAAATLIIKEAGGRVTGFGNERFSIYGDECLASNGRIHGDMVDVLTGRI